MSLKNEHGKIVDLEEKRRRHSPFVWDGQRVKLKQKGRDWEKEFDRDWARRQQRRQKVLLAVAVLLAVCVLGSALLKLAR
ncbi:MAG: hypothetical protein AB1556_16195 [Bacillota bacterium]